MAVNNFEQSRTSQGTLRRDANEIGNTARADINQSNALSRDDVRDGFEAPLTSKEDAREGYGKLRGTEREGVAGNNTGSNDTVQDTTTSRDRRRRRVLSAGTL